MILKVINKIFQDRSKLSLVLILGTAFFLRFVHYGNRWGLAYDQAHDAILARYALETFSVPLVGPFSSGVQFQTSGAWYWFIMLGTTIYPGSIITPWIVLTLFYVGFVFLIYVLGRELVGEKFGLLVSLLAAVSTAQIGQATNLTNQSPLAFMSALAILFLVKFHKTKKSFYLFLMGASCGLAPTIHLQGVPLILLIPIAVVILGIWDVKKLLLIAAGLILPFTPLIIFDLQNDFVNVSGLVNHLLYKQYEVSYEVLGRRWLTYLGVFWPSSWALVSGGNVVVSYILILILISSIGISVIRGKLEKLWTIILSAFIVAVIMIRYVRTPIFDSYLVFLHPFMFLLTGFAILFVFKLNKYLGFAFLLVIVSFSLVRNYYEISRATNNAYITASDFKKQILQKFPDKKFDMYDYSYRWTNLSVPLVLELYIDKKIDDHGYKIGLQYSTISAELAHPVIYGEGVGIKILDLNSSSSSELLNSGWYSINPSRIYNATENWYMGKN